jgi:hypothetical protein
LIMDFLSSFLAARTRNAAALAWAGPFTQAVTRMGWARGVTEQSPRRTANGSN